MGERSLNSNFNSVGIHKANKNCGSSVADNRDVLLWILACISTVRSFLTSKMGEVEPFSISPSSLQFQLPVRIVLSGSSGAGKSFFVKELIEKSYYMMNRPFSAIYYFYVSLNSTILEIAKNNPKVILKQGFTLDQILGHDGKSDILAVIDDHLSRPIYDQLADLFAIHSRQSSISVCLISQNMFTKVANASRYNREVLMNR